MQLAAVLGLSPDVIAVHEPSPMLLEIGAAVYASACEGDRWRWMARGIRDEHVAFAAHNKKVYVETNNRLTFLAPALAEVYPASRFIHLHRHPYEVVRSGLSRKWYAGGAVDFSLIQPRQTDPLFGSWTGMQPVEKIAWFWTRINEDALKFMATLPVERRHTLKAASLFACDEQEIASMFAFVGARPPRAAAVQAALGRQLNATRGRSATDTLPHEASVRQIVGTVAETLGYEL